MPIYTVEDTATGKRYKVEGDRPPTEADMRSLLQNMSQPVKQDSFAENALDVAGEIAAGANRTAMYIPDTVVGGVNAIAGTDIPTLSEGIERLTGQRPGQGGYMEPGAARDAAGAFGEVAIPGSAALKAVQGRNVASVPGAAAEFLGFGSAAPTSTAVAASDDVARDLALKRRSGDSVAAGYRLDEFGKVKPDSTQGRALKAGLDEGVVAQIASGSPADKKRMAQMLDIVEQGRKNKTFADFNSPRLALGDSLMERYSLIKQVNKAAGKELSSVLQEMKGKPVDLDALYSGPVQSFIDDLADAGVRVDKGRVYFRGSDFEGLPEAEKIINDLVSRMVSTDTPDAYGVHRLKKFIDERVTYGESVKGLKGKAINSMKALRSGVNDFLRQQDPAYAKINEVYSDTIGLLNEAQDLAGKKTEISERELGRIARQGLSNAQRSGRVQDLLENMDEAAKRYGLDLGDDVQRQTSFVQTLEKLFNVSPPASLKGELSKAGDQTAEAINAARGGTDSLVGLAAKGVNKVFSKSDKQRQEDLIKALRELIAAE